VEDYAHKVRGEVKRHESRRASESEEEVEVL
jgi:hypothetical protein